MIAQSALAQYGKRYGFSHVTFIPTGCPPHRHNNPDLVASEHRLAMVEHAIAENPFFEVSTIELSHEQEDTLKSPTLHYTHKTLCKLHRESKEPFEPLLIMGSDALSLLGTWYAAEKLLESVQFLQAPRPETPFVENITVSATSHPVMTKRIGMPPLGISSTWIREMLSQSDGINLDAVRYFLPEAVLNYIKTHSLYF